MKKLCFVVTDAISFNLLMKGQLEYLISKGYNLTLICGGNKEQIDLLKSRNVGKVKVIPFSRDIKIFNDLLCLFRLWFFLLFNRFDSIIYSTPKALLLTAIAAFFSLTNNRICMFRGRVYENYTGMKLSFFKILDKIAIKLSQKIIFISKSLKDEYIKSGLLKSSCGYVVGAGSSNGIDVRGVDKKDFSMEVKRIKSIINYKNDDFVVVFLGRHCVDKGIEQWETIFKKTNNKRIKFVSAGNIEDELSEGVVSRLLSYDNYFYLGQIDSVFPLLKLANIHLFLSHREGFGNVAIESAILGVPTFAYDVVGVKDSVNNISGILFNFLDTELIVKEILRLSSSELLSSEFNENEMKYWAINNFNQKYVWSEYEKLY